jgi:hypothetical protein
MAHNQPERRIKSRMAFRKGVSFARWIKGSGWQQILD